mmetsp:Transcript_69171/g.218822  ORF Transcript_69171/g.218822 Transcript_69171/m.218822 type:complete len:234 (-) Transcript_69171:196-897(-)
MSSLKPQLGVIVLDWDGTVVDSIQHIVESWSRAFIDSRPRLSTPFEDPGEVEIRRCIGMSVDATIAKLVPGATEEDMDVVRTVYGDYFRAGAGGIRMFDSARESLESLRAQGFLLAVATGKSRRGLDRELDALGCRDLFVATRTADLTTSKPHPQMLLEVLEETNMRPDHAVMIGDSVLDLMMAANAGVQGVAVAYGAEPIEALRVQPAIYCASDWPDLFSFLSGTFRPLGGN